MTDDSTVAGLRRPVRRLVIVITVALAGLTTSAALQLSTGVAARQFDNSVIYGKGITALLAVGLFASVYGISRRELRRNAWVVLVAVTVGVTAKAFIAGGVMAAVYGTAGYLLLGVAVAQIDPLSVAASLDDSRMSARAKAVLSAWASFDDPVTVLLVAYLAAATLPGVRARGAGALAGLGAGSPVTQIGMNAVLVMAAAAGWYLIEVRGPGVRTVRGNAAACAVLVALIAAAVSFGLLVGITVCGLFFRPRLERVISRVVGGAFCAATFLMGMLLITGLNVAAGIVLGVVVFAAQALVGTAISRGMAGPDRMRLALGQQNGLTAIVLALALQPYLPSAVGIIAVAILAVNTLHIVANGLAELALIPEPAGAVACRRAGPEPASASASAGRKAA